MKKEKIEQKESFSLSNFQKISPFGKKGADLYEWGLKWIKTFPNQFDKTFLKGVYFLLGLTPEGFLENRDLFHLKRLVAIAYVLGLRSQEDPSRFHVKIFSLESKLCIAISYPKKNHPLSGEIVASVAEQKISSLKIVEGSSYQSSYLDRNSTIFYIELEKMRGRDLSLQEMEDLTKYLENQLYFQTAEPTVFWPYNYREAYNQLEILAKEVTSIDDVPQVSIHFQKQTNHYLEFLIYLARVKATIKKNQEVNESCFPISVQLIVHVREEKRATVPVVIEAFSLFIPVSKCRRESVINLLYGREYLVKILESVIGPFRDYNGGLFETQKYRFDDLASHFSENIPSFSLFGKDLFYALRPIEAQVYLDSKTLEQFFRCFSSCLFTPPPCLIECDSQVLVIKEEKLHKIPIFLKKIKALQEEKKIIAYAEMEALSHHYLCLLSSQETSLAKIVSTLNKLRVTRKKRKRLRLAFQSGEIPSFHPYDLNKEMRGRTLSKLLFEGLFRYNCQGEVTYAACKKVTISHENTRYFFELRDLYWSDGKKGTARDYEHTWKNNFFSEDAMNPFYLLKNAEAIRRGEQSIDCLGVKAVNEKCLQVDLEYPDSRFLSKLTYSCFFPLMHAEADSLQFNGPYVARKLPNKLLLEKNPYYWDKSNVFFEEILISSELSSEKINRLFEKGKIDWVGSPFSYDSSIKRSFLIDRVYCPFFLYLNLEFPPFSSRLIRQALSCVLDRSFISQMVISRDRPLFTFFSEKSVQARPSLQDGLVQQAKEQFAQGMEELGLTKETFPIVKMRSCSLKRDLQLANYLKKTWESAFGIQVEVEVNPWNLFYQKVERGDFHVSGFFRGILPFDVIPFLEGFTSYKRNFSRWESPEFTELVKQIKETKEGNEREKRIKKAQELLLFHMPIIPLLSLSYAYNHRPPLEGYFIDEDGSVDFRFAFMRQGRFARNKPIENRVVPYGQNRPLLSLSEKQDIVLD